MMKKRSASLKNYSHAALFGLGFLAVTGVIFLQRYQLDKTKSLAATDASASFSLLMAPCANAAQELSTTASQVFSKFNVNIQESRRYHIYGNDRQRTRTENGILHMGLMSDGTDLRSALMHRPVINGDLVAQVTINEISQNNEAGFDGAIPFALDLSPSTATQEISQVDIHRLWVYPMPSNKTAGHVVVGGATPPTVVSGSTVYGRPVSAPFKIRAVKQGNTLKYLVKDKNTGGKFVLLQEIAITPPSSAFKYSLAQMMLVSPNNAKSQGRLTRVKIDDFRIFCPAGSIESDLAPEEGVTQVE
jgi:hypothetical protein